jgi:hypothetical protein
MTFRGLAFRWHGQFRTAAWQAAAPLLRLPARRFMAMIGDLTENANTPTQRACGGPPVFVFEARAGFRR